MSTILTDRTTATTDDKCGMARWWYKHEDGKGIVPANTPEALEDGGDIHADLEQIGLGVPVLDVVGPILNKVEGSADQLLLERVYRRAAWCVGVALFVEPSTRQEFETVSLEHELVLDRGPLWVACTPDRVLKRLAEPRAKVYREYKSVGMMTRGWMNHWARAIQLQIGMAAEGEDTGEYCSYAEIMGLFKGQWKEGYLHHPYVWPWVKGEGSNKDNWDPYYSYGRERHPIWEYPGGIVEWVTRCGAEVAQGVFPFSAPVPRDEDMLERWVIARTHREQEVAAVVESARKDEETRLKYFRQCFDQCTPVIGAECAYLAACHNREVNVNPLRSGLYIRRQPHHEVEVLGVE